MKNTPVFSNIKKRKLDSLFSFRKTTQEEVSKVIRDLNTKKSCQTSATPTKIIKLNSDIFSNLIYKHFNYCIDKGEFPNDLKHADIVPVYKKNNKCEKENYRPVSILSNLSKIYEKLMYSQIYDYFDNILFPSQCGFRIGYSTQHCLLVMLEIFKEAIDRGKDFGALLTDLSKAFELSFDQHLSSICSKASKKLHALGRIATFMSFKIRRTLMKAFIESQLNYCPLIWMFHSRITNNKISRIHERALRFILILITSPLLTNYLKKTDHFLFTTRTFKV